MMILPLDVICTYIHTALFPITMAHNVYNGHEAVGQSLGPRESIGTATFGGHIELPASQDWKLACVRCNMFSLCSAGGDPDQCPV